MSVHPDIAWIVNQVDDEPIARGKDAGLRDAFTFLEALADSNEGSFADGIDDAAVEVGRALAQTDEYFNRATDIDPDKLNFDPTLLLEALADVVEQARPYGWSAAVEAAREHRDEYPLPDELDPEDEDTDPEDYASEVDYANGAEYAARQLVEHFGEDPDPEWEPE